MTAPHSTMAEGARAAIAALAVRQHGVVARRQLLAAGVSPDVVDRRLKAGWLRPMHRGVYLVGDVAAPGAAEMAACLACGASAVVSHRSAAALWQLLGLAELPVIVDVTIREGNRSRRDIRIHRIGTLQRDEVTKVNGIPTTTPARTLYDLASVAGTRDLERAVAQAFARRLATPAQVRALLARHPGRAGSRDLRRVLDDGEPALTRSEAEERFLGLIRRAQLGAPEVNVAVGGQEVDFLWAREQLVAEIDGYAFHSSRDAFERDRRRDAVLVAAGLRVVRVTWRQILDEPEAVLARLAQALARTARP